MWVAIIVILILVYAFTVLPRYSTFAGSYTSSNILSRVSPFANKPKIQENKRSTELLNWVDSVVSKIQQDLDSRKGESAVVDQMARRLRKTYDRESMFEHYPTKPATDVSYNVDKGESIAMCLREWSPEGHENAEHHDENEVLFVALHEIAHSLNCDETSYRCGDSYGHDKMFWFIFKKLLDSAERIGSFKKVNYAKHPVNYCSMDITYNPQFDPTLSDTNFA